MAAEVNEGEAEIRHEIVADEAESYLTKQRPVELWVHQVSNQRQEEEQGGDQQGCRVEDKCEFLTVFLLVFLQAESECNLQICLRISGCIALPLLINISALIGRPVTWRYIRQKSVLL